MVSAIVVLKGIDGVEGTISFQQEREGSPVSINGTVKGLKGGLHGIHVHTNGDLSNGCISAGAHYNPFNREHGGPNDYERHVGDLGNIRACSSTGVAIVSKKDNVISLFGEYSIIGRTLVIHADPDDLGRGGQSDSKTTGHAGARVACGIIARN